MADELDTGSIPELDTAIDALAAAGGFDRLELTDGLARLVARQAKFQTLRNRLDPRFAAIARSNSFKPLAPR